MATFTIELAPDTADLVTRAAAESGTQVEAYIAAVAETFVREQEALTDLPPTPEEAESMRRALEDVRAGRLTDHDEVFARLDAKHGWR